MTVPSYTEDLTDVATGDEATGWDEFTGNNYDAQGTQAYQDEEYPYIQGSFAVTQICTKDASVGSLGYNPGTITIPTDGALFVWSNFSSAYAMGTYAQGGFRVVMGDSWSTHKAWYTGGNDKGRYPYGGFQCHVANPTVSADDTAGSPTATISHVGAAVYVVTGISKGEVHQVDTIRYGRGSSIFEHGEAANYADIAGFAAQNDNINNMWGLIQTVPGGYLWKGRMQLGTTSNPVDFRDSNIIIFIDWTPKVTANFNTIEVIDSTSNVEMTGFQFICLDPSGTASKGRWITTDNATIVLTSCSFIDMSTFVFDSNSTLTSTTWSRCGQVTQGGGVFDGCVFEESDAEVSLLVDDLDNIDNCDFTSDGSNHAMKLTEDHAGNSYTLTGCTYTDYASVDGSTGNEVIFNDSTGHVIINVVGGDVPTIRNGLGATTALPTSVSLTMTVKDEAGDPIDGAFAYIDDDNITPFIMNTTTSALGVATVQHTGGAAPGSSWRVRKYGYKPYAQTVDIGGSDISIPVTLISDPQQT